MKTFLCLFVFLGVFTFSLSATTVFSERYSGTGVVKVYVTEYESQADLKVYKVQYSGQASKNDGHWFFTNYSGQAKKKIHFVKYASQADLKIFDDVTNKRPSAKR